MQQANTPICLYAVCVCVSFIVHFIALICDDEANCSDCNEPSIALENNALDRTPAYQSDSEKRSYVPLQNWHLNFRVHIQLLTYWLHMPSAWQADQAAHVKATHRHTDIHSRLKYSFVTIDGSLFESNLFTRIASDLILCNKNAKRKRSTTPLSSSSFRRIPNCWLHVVIVDGICCCNGSSSDSFLSFF